MYVSGGIVAVIGSCLAVWEWCFMSRLPGMLTSTGLWPFMSLDDLTVLHISSAFRGVLTVLLLVVLNSFLSTTSAAGVPTLVLMSACGRVVYTEVEY